MLKNNFFENVLLAGEILKKLKMLKMGGTMFVHIRHQYTNMVPPIFNIFNFFRISPARSTFSKKKKKKKKKKESFFFYISPARSTYQQKNAPTGEMLKVGFSLFNISPARSTFSKVFLTFPQPEAHNPPKKRSHWGNVKSWFFTF